AIAGRPGRIRMWRTRSLEEPQLGQSLLLSQDLMALPETQTRLRHRIVVEEEGRPRLPRRHPRPARRSWLTEASTLAIPRRLIACSAAVFRKHAPRVPRARPSVMGFRATTIHT